MLADAELNRLIGTGLGRLAAVAMLCALVSCATPGIDTAAPGAVSGQPAFAVQPPVGLPPDKTAYLGGQVASALSSHGISIAPAPDAPARYKLLGYCSAADGGGSTSVVCVWDTNTSDGTRANRIVTEESVRGSSASNPWSVVGNQTLGRMAETVAGKVAAWLPSAPAAPATGISLAPSGGFSLGNGPANAVALTGVTGAPGDGNRALARAMTSALRSNNIPVTRANPNAFRLAGTVQLGPPEGGEQELLIDWTLTTAGGASLGTVSQRNRVPVGALDRTWGATADTSAVAAAKGIIQLMPNRG